jgi:hypothetical protein
VGVADATGSLYAACVFCAHLDRFEDILACGHQKRMHGGSQEKRREASLYGGRGVAEAGARGWRRDMRGNQHGDGDNMVGRRVQVIGL